MMPDYYREKFVEPIAHPIYSLFRTPHRPEEMRELLDDPELYLSTKFTAILAAFAYLQFPLKFSAFRRLIPDAFWEEYVHCFYNLYWQNISTYRDEDDRPFMLCMGPQSSPYGLYNVLMVTREASIFTDDNPRGAAFDPPVDLAIDRYTLGHPFLKSELHEPDGIYLFKSQ